ncbi:MAG: hypothetical protein PHD93_03505 [Candidatus Pacebacteria bacterium]|jgi:uncharacterized membrane protein|nr:hypothetical protein [Candidatus Paceibacterota bacterium]
MKKRHLFSIVFGLILFLGSIILRISNTIEEFAFTIMMTAGASMFAVGMVRYKRYGDGPEKDERTMKISYTALAASFQITLMVVLGIWWVDYFNPIQLSINQLLGILFFVMIILNILFRIYYSKKENLML